MGFFPFPPGPDRFDLLRRVSPRGRAFGRGLDELERVAERAGILLYD